MRKGKSRRWIIISICIKTMMFATTSAADACVGNGDTFHVQENASACVRVGQGQRVINCVVSGLLQNSNVLITSSAFSPNSSYPIPSTAVLLNHNTQRITFSGTGATPAAQLTFSYYGPWDPSYAFELTCKW